jgi:4-amino-4-deoxy-L-arabinose transferase-like glycosyltransferase
MSTSALPHPAPVLSPGWFSARARSLLRGRAEDPAWVRPLLIALLLGTAMAYLIDLQASGYANEFYSAAAQAATKSWKAFFFGSLDSSSFITVDKPPASVWVMALSGRVFGFSHLSVLAPQALEGVLSVGLLYAAIKRWFGAGAGLLAGLVLALTPVAALMFRFNNPDALLVCLLIAAGYCLVRALETASTRWVIAVGTLVGFAFLTKMLQAFLVLPAFGLVYLVAAPTGLRRRLGQLVAGGAAIVITGGWWVAIVALWPAGSRPMIDGSANNSILNLITGYNGLGRVFGATGPGGGGPGPQFSGSTGVPRLFNDLMGGQASWLLPAALVVLGGGLWLTRTRPRHDRARAALLLWGGWLVVSGLVFSLSSGVIHTYYTVALAPAIAALVAIGAASAWRHRERPWVRLALAGVIIGTAGWSWVLLARTPQWQPWLRPVIAATAVLAASCLLLPRLLARPRAKASFAALAACACLAGPVAYSIDTIATAHTGSIPSAGPSVSADTGFGGPGGFAGGGRFGGGVPSIGGTSGVNGRAPGDSPAVSSALASILQRGASGYRWAAATSGSKTASGLELASGGAPVMAIGGFDGQGGNLTLAQFEKYVTQGQIHYLLAPVGGVDAGGFGGPPGAGAGFGGPPPGAGGFGGPPPGAGGPGGPGGGPRGASTQAIANWVQSHFKSTTVGNQVVYDLTQPKGR